MGKPYWNKDWREQHEAEHRRIERETLDRLYGYEPEPVQQLGNADWPAITFPPFPVIASLVVDARFRLPFTEVTVSRGKITFMGELEMQSHRRERAWLTGFQTVSFYGEDDSLVASWRKDFTGWGIDRMRRGSNLVIQWSLDDIIVSDGKRLL